MKCEITTSDGCSAETAPVEGSVYEGQDIYNNPIWTLEIESLEDLLTLHTKVRYPLILGYNDDRTRPQIEIYNGYRE